MSLAIVSGRVVDERGVPVRAAIVGASCAQDRSVGRTNARGRFSLGIAAAEPVRLLARKPGFAFRVVPRIEPWSDVTIVLERGADVSGRVIADPLPRFRIRLRPATTSSVLCRPDGRFSISRVPPGVYELSAEADGCDAAVAVIDVRPGRDIAGLELRLTRR